MGKEYRTWLSYFAEDKRYAAMTGLGFSSSLPSVRGAFHSYNIKWHPLALLSRENSP
jgi:hypothetical protein